MALGFGLVCKFKLESSILDRISVDIEFHQTLEIFQRIFYLY